MTAKPSCSTIPCRWTYQASTFVFIRGRMDRTEPEPLLSVRSNSRAAVAIVRSYPTRAQLCSHHCGPPRDICTRVPGDRTGSSYRFWERLLVHSELVNLHSIGGFVPMLRVCFAWQFLVFVASPPFEARSDITNTQTEPGKLMNSPFNRVTISKCQGLSSQRADQCPAETIC